jgi:hypothetical protein
LARIGNFIVKDSDISRIKLELITFFKHNPGTVDCAESIARCVSRPVKEVEEALEQLTRHDICKRLASRPRPVYMYRPSAQVLQRISELVPEMDYQSQLRLLETLMTPKGCE